jgi:hypothetical protein
MQKQFLYTLIGICLLLITSCQKDNAADNIVKVNIAYDETNTEKYQKLSINASLQKPEFNWETGDQIKLVSSNGNSLKLDFVSAANNAASFKLASGTITPNDYKCFTNPANASVTASGVNYSAPSTFLIDINDVDNYISNHMLLYTKTKYTHGHAGNIARLYPAMTILEIPLQCTTGTVIINTITLKAKGVTQNGAFISSARLPNVFLNDSSFTQVNYTNSINYQFSGNGLTVGATATTIKLLVWSAHPDSVSGLTGYSIIINNGYDTNSFQKTTAFSNSNYYRTPNLSIPVPVIGDWYQGGIVCTTYVMNNITHGYVCDSVAIGSYVWSPNTTTITTNTIIGSGNQNTTNIYTVFGQGNSYAARVCYDATRNGYNDWFLPSINELQLAYNIRNNPRRKFDITNYKLYYWSSSQNTTQKAYTFNFPNNQTNTPQKSKTNLVLPMRQF